MVNKKIPEMLSGLLRRNEETRYIRMIYLACGLLFVLAARLFYMQIVEGAYYKSEADGNRIREIPVQAARGILYDRNGIIMAGSRKAYSVVMPIDRQRSSLSEEELNRLSAILSIPAETLKKRIEDHKTAFGSIYLANDVSIDIATQIEEKKDEFPGIDIEVMPLRVYPLGDAGAQTLGYVGEAGPDDRDANGNPYASSTLIGRAGLERDYNQYLEGKNGIRLVEVNASGQPVGVAGGRAAFAGHDIRLTLDAHLQVAAEDAINEQMQILAKDGVYPTGATAVAVDPNTGAILAMVSWPSYDPNWFARGITEREWNGIINNPNHPLQNRTISSMYPPGSTFKPITAAAALEAKVVTPDERIYDSGKHWIIDKRNAAGEAFGWIDFYEAMAKSDNVYFYEMGRRAGIGRLSEMAREFGLGQVTGIDLSGESEGNVASEEYKQKVFNQDWYLGETFDAAIGQSFNLATPLQMAMVYAAIANGGFRYKPYLVSRIDNMDGTPLVIYAPKQMGTLPISKTTLHTVQESLRRVMTKEGTGGFLFHDYPIATAGKSGTAEISDGLDNGWFIAYGPFEKPEIVVAVMFEHSGYGSDSAAPVVKKIMDAFFRYGEYQGNASQSKAWIKAGGAP